MTNISTTYIDNDGLTVTKELNGTYLKYLGGDACDDGSDKSFTIRIMCDLNLDLENFYYTGYASTDTCTPHVTIVSSIGCDVF